MHALMLRYDEPYCIVSHLSLVWLSVEPKNKPVESEKKKLF